MARCPTETFFDWLALMARCPTRFGRVKKKLRARCHIAAHSAAGQGLACGTLKATPRTGVTECTLPLRPINTWAEIYYCRWRFALFAVWRPWRASSRRRPTSRAASSSTKAKPRVEACGWDSFQPLKQWLTSSLNSTFRRPVGMEE